MIVDRLHHLSKYESMHPRFKAAFAFLNTLIEGGAKDGRYAMPNADVENAVYVILNTGELKADKKAVCESHERYIDVQVVLSGEELMCVPAREMPPVTKPYDGEGDYALYEAIPFEDCHRLQVSAGSFVIFFARELHAPSLSLEATKAPVRKAIVKVLA